MRTTWSTLHWTAGLRPETEYLPRAAKPAIRLHAFEAEIDVLQRAREVLALDHANGSDHKGPILLAMAEAFLGQGDLSKRKKVAAKKAIDESEAVRSHAHGRVSGDG